MQNEVAQLLKNIYTVNYAKLSSDFLPGAAWRWRISHALETFKSCKTVANMPSFDWEVNYTLLSSSAANFLLGGYFSQRCSSLKLFILIHFRKKIWIYAKCCNLALRNNLAKLAVMV
jgi:hypothetical protein